MTLLALLATVTLFALLSSAVGQPDTITPVRRWITAPPSDENAPNWVGYVYINHTFQGFDYNPGATFTVIGNAAGCVSATTYVTVMQTSCSDSSVLVGPPEYTPYTCPNGACQVGFILKNFVDTVTTTIVSCDESTSFNFTIYRATTYSATTPPSVEASTTLDTTSFTMSTGSSSATSSSSIQASSQSAMAPSSKNNSNAIALGVGIGVGLPSILIALCAWWFPRQRNKVRKEHDALETRKESTILSSPPHNPDRLGNTIELNDTRSPPAANENGYAIESSDIRSPHNPSERGITIESSDTRLTRGTAG